ncbi:MAG: winged helix-turn-helix domain-containing protein [Anaerolineales bacterium]|jgi:DNA-binding response OmpR family regulator
MQALLLVYNPDESAVLRLVLQRVGLAARITTDLEQAANDWPAQPADLIFLAFDRRDIPVQFIRQLRAFTSAPILVFTDPLPEDLHITLLDAGIDQIIFRPYSARILMAQTRAWLRRSSETTYFNLPAVIQGDLELDPSLRLFKAAGSPAVRLTQLEFRLLHILMTHPDKAYPTESLVEHVWGYSGNGDRDLVRGLIRRLRAKIEPDPNTPRYILTLPGVGYTFHSQDEPFLGNSP